MSEIEGPEIFVFNLKLEIILKSKRLIGQTRSQYALFWEISKHPGHEAAHWGNFARNSTWGSSRKEQNIYNMVSHQYVYVVYV